MSDSIQTQGKTVNEAVSEALLQLGLRRDEVEIKVLEEPKSGLLGFIGARQAKVLVRKKPERKRGRGRSRGRSDDDQAITLGTGRGGRGRNRRDDDGEKQESRGRRDDRRSRDDDKDGDDNRRSRGRRGGRGRGRGGDSRRDEQRDDKQVAASGNEQRDDRSRNDEGGDEARRTRRNRRGSRGRGRGRGRDQEVQADGNSRDESREQSREQARGESRSGRDRDNGNRENGNRDEERRESRSRRSRSRRSEDEDNGRAAARADAPEPNGNVRDDDAPVTREPRSRRERPAAMVASEHPNESENPTMSEQQQPEPVETPAPTPAPVEEPQGETPAPAPEPVEEKPAAAKPKRGGWGGGLGARLPKRDNPAVKNRKPVEVLPDAPASGVSASYGGGSSRRGDRRDRGGRDDFAPRPGSGPEEMIAAEVPATRYAQAVTGVGEENLNEALVELTNGMLVRAGFPCEVEVHDGDYRRVRIASEDEDDAGMLIGRHGQTVDAVEHLVERMASNAIDDRVRMNLDINGYRDRREEDLADRIDEAVAEVRETGRPWHAEPMSARERRVIHLRVEEIDGVCTRTVIGNGGKHVVIALEDDGDEDRNED